MQIPTRRALLSGAPAIALMAAVPAVADDLSPKWRSLAYAWGMYGEQVETIARQAQRRGFTPDDVTCISLCEKKLLAYFGDWNGPVGAKYTVIHAAGGYNALVFA